MSGIFVLLAYAVPSLQLVVYDCGSGPRFCGT